MKLRLLFAAVVFGIIFYFVDFSELAKTLLAVQLDYLLYLLLIGVVMVWLSALKWQVFVRAGGHEAGILHLMKLYTVGYFFNTFTPSYIGGDIARSYHLGRYLNSQKDAFTATFLERFSGLLAMSLLAVLFVCLGAEATAGVEYLIFFVATGAVVLFLVFFSEKVSRLFESLAERFMDFLLPKKISVKLVSFMKKVLAAMDSARGNKELFIKAILLSLAFHVGTVVNTWVAAKAVGWENPDFMGMFVVVPLVLLVSMVPLTPSGLGIQEGAFLFFLQIIGASKTQALGVGFVLRAKVLFIALLGGLIWLTIRSKEETAESADKDSKLSQKEITIA